MTTKSDEDVLFTVNFALICLVTFGFFAGQFFILATIPLYARHIGATLSDIGLIIGASTLTSLVMRLFIGRAIDIRGSKLLIIIGVTVALSSMILYNFTNTVPLLIALRAFQGIGMACFTTAGPSFVANVAPMRRRGEAMSYNMIFTSIAQMVAPPLGVALIIAGSFSPVFFAAAAVDFITLLLALRLSEKNVVSSSPTLFRARSGLISRSALLPGVIYLFHSISMGVINSFMPVFAVERGLGNPGLYFTTYALVTTLLRATTGRLSDRYGRMAAIVPGMLATASSMVLLSFSTSTLTFLSSAFFYGVGSGWVQPAVQALAVDGTRPEDRGAAMGTLQASLDLGHMIGSILMGRLLDVTSFTTVYLTTALATFGGLMVYVWVEVRQSAARRAHNRGQKE